MSGFGPAFHSSTVVVFVAAALVPAPAAPAAYVQRRPRSVPRPESGSPYGEHRVRALPRTIKLTTGRPAAAKGTRPWPHRRDAPAPPGSSAAPPYGLALTVVLSACGGGSNETAVSPGGPGVQSICTLATFAAPGSATARTPDTSRSLRHPAHHEVPPTYGPDITDHRASRSSPAPPELAKPGRGCLGPAAASGPRRSTETARPSKSPKSRPPLGTPTRSEGQKNTLRSCVSAGQRVFIVEPRRFELLTSALQRQRSTN